MTHQCWYVPQYTPSALRMRVVLPVCNRDWELMLRNLAWQAELERRKNFDCVISADGELPEKAIQELEFMAWKTYANVEVYTYPSAPNKQWPHGPNWAFQKTAHMMASVQRPWFWMEPDCVPLQPNWLEKWNLEYVMSHKAIMGVLVQGMGHCNGTAVYPWNFNQLCPDAMTCTDVAWDGLMKQSTIRMTHNAAHLLCHVWGIENGRAVPFGGNAAYFSSWDDVRSWVDLRAILFHRDKYGTLIDELFKHKKESKP